MKIKDAVASFWYNLIDIWNLPSTILETTMQVNRTTEHVDRFISKENHPSGYPAATHIQTSRGIVMNLPTITGSCYICDDTRRDFERYDEDNPDDYEPHWSTPEFLMENQCMGCGEQIESD